MEAVFSGAGLALAVKSLEKVVSKKVKQHPVLANVRFQAKVGSKSSITAVCLSGESGIEFLTVKVDCEVDQEFDVTFPMATLSAAAGNSSSLTVSYEGEDKVKINWATTTILPSSDFPEFPDNSTVVEEFTVDGASFLEALSSCYHSASSDPCKLALNGIFLGFQGNDLRMASTDGHRLVSIKLDGVVQYSNQEGAKEVKKVLPLTMVTNISKLLFPKATVETVQFQFFKGGKGVIQYAVNGVAFIHRFDTIAHEYPNYERLFPERFDNNSVFPWGPLYDTLTKASKIVKSGNNVIKFSFPEHDDSVVIEGHGTVEETKQELSFNDTVQAVNDVKNCSAIAFNCQYLLEALKTPYMKGNRRTFAEMHFDGPTNPAVLVNPERDNFRLLIMPVQIRTW